MTTLSGGHEQLGLPARGSDDERRRARRTVAIYAERAGADRAETRDLLDMLGLLGDEVRLTEVRTIRPNFNARRTW